MTKPNHVYLDKNGSNNLQTTVLRVMWMNLDQNTVSDLDEHGSNYPQTSTKTVLCMNMVVITPSQEGTVPTRVDEHGSTYTQTSTLNCSLYTRTSICQFFTNQAAFKYTHLYTSCNVHNLIQHQNAGVANCCTGGIYRLRMVISFQTIFINLNTFTATVNLSRSNFSIALFQLKSADLAGNLYSSFSISSRHYLYPFYSLLCLHCDIMNPCLSLCSEGQ